MGCEKDWVRVDNIHYTVFVITGGDDGGKGSGGESWEGWVHPPSSPSPQRGRERGRVGERGEEGVCALKREAGNGAADSHHRSWASQGRETEAGGA